MAHSNTSYKVQSVLVPRTWTKVQADTWVRAHGYKVTYYGKKGKIVGEYRHYKQRKKDAKKDMRTVPLPNGVKLREFVVRK